MKDNTLNRIYDELSGVLASEPEKRFCLIRKSDVSGVSGTGCVLDGFVMKGGQCVAVWRGKVSSISIFRSFDEFMDIHVNSHPTNGSIIEWGENET